MCVRVYVCDTARNVLPHSFAFSQFFPDSIDCRIKGASHLTGADSECVCVRVRERQRGRERQRETETERERVGKRSNETR